MSARPLLAAIGLALIVAVGGIFPALAQVDAIPDGQKPPAEQQAKPPEPEKPKCVASNTGFKEKGGKPVYEIELVNSCDMRVKCTIDVFVMGARGTAQGHSTLVLQAAPKGQTTSKIYTLKVKSAGGMANMSQSCKAI